MTGLPRLDELWLYTNLDCNLRCRHCFLGDATRTRESARPPLARLLAIVDEALDLGARRVFLTGGEPFLRDDLPLLLAHASRSAKVCVLTNATLVHDDTAAAFAAAGLDALRPRVSFHVSIDGPRAVHDATRGRGAFNRTMTGIRVLQRWGARPALVTALTADNVGSAHEVTRLAADLGLAVHHLLLPHRSGRMGCGDVAAVPTAEQVLAAVRACRAVAELRGVTMANDAVMAARVRDPERGYDGCSGGTDMLTVGVDGRTYACPLLVGRGQSAAPASSLAAALAYHRQAGLASFSLQERPSCAACDVNDICGGGCAVRAGSHEVAGRGVEPPFCDAYRGLVHDHLAMATGAGVQQPGVASRVLPRRRYACSCTAN